MLLTEEQAQGKWCPHVRTTWNGTPAYNRDSRSDSIPPSSRCISSACMSWRWHEGLAELPDGNFWLRTDESLSGANIRRSDAVGYCGLAGGRDDG